MTFDTDQLLGSREVADVLGLSSPNSVSVYLDRYDDMQRPVVDRPPCRLGDRTEVETWARGR